MRKSASGDSTFRTVRDRYQGWFGGRDRGFLPGRTIADDHHELAAGGGKPMNRMVLMGIGGGIGLVLLALAMLSFVTAGRWSDIARDGAEVGYTLIGFFLTVAGLGSIIATWNHNFRNRGASTQH
ncbi:MAG TPA: hypothetical protein VHG28_18000 [Longimicrobiaceae bacterium]|nr:hypothetical protein [Longimicrobiaceae bacterium]